VNGLPLQYNRVQAAPTRQLTRILAPRLVLHYSFSAQNINKVHTLLPGDEQLIAASFAEANGVWHQDKASYAMVT
jgi:hypothetical protein